MTKSRGVLLIILIAAALWAIGLAQWQAGTVGADTMGPAGVAQAVADQTTGASPIATSCVAIIAVTGLLSAMFARIGRFVVLGIGALAGVGYIITAAAAISAPGATAWPIIALLAGIVATVGVGFVLVTSAKWTGSNRYSRAAEAEGEDFDSAAAWDALSRGDEIDRPEPKADGDSD